jgi:aryl-alcohol dehydrogenase-like predicted oxidoreductase
MEHIRFDRRKFLGALALGTAHLLFENPLYGKNNRFTSANPLQPVSLGTSGLRTSLVGFGTGVHAGNRTSFLTRQDKDKSMGLLKHAYDRGFRMYDCADIYGTHGIMGEAMKSMDRDSLTLTTKIWTRENSGIPEKERPDADVVVDRFRKELDTDYIDLVQIHCMVDAQWTDIERRQMDILEDLKARGIIRAHGVSVHSYEAMERVVEDPWVDVLHARVNPFGMSMDKKDPEEVVRLIHKVHQSGKGTIGMKLVGNGKLKEEMDKIDQSIKFVLGLGSVDMVIVGFEDEYQVNNYMDRVESALRGLVAGR